jgi:hypothetical protein
VDYDLKWYSLDCRAIREVERRLKRGRAFTKLVLSRLDLNSGVALCLDCMNAPPDELYSFEFGDLSAGRQNLQRAIAQELCAYARNRHGQVLLSENPGDFADDMFREREWVDFVVYDSVPVYYSTFESTERIANAIEAATAACLMNAFVLSTEKPFVKDTVLDTSAVANLAAATHLVLTESYDGTGYVLWKRNDSDFEPSVFPPAI